MSSGGGKKACFIQIATATEQSALTKLLVPVLLALDDTGRVWEFNRQTRTWRPLPDERKEE